MVKLPSPSITQILFFTLLVNTQLFANTVTEVITYASTFPVSVGGTQPSALKAELNYDDAALDAPIAVVMHQFSASSGNFSRYRSNALALQNRGFFVITPGMRGRDGSDGSRDTGALEIHDILDAVEAVKAQYPDLVDPDYVYITGYSGGGGNVMSSITKFPDYWNAVSSFFGISDYGYDSTYGWYFNGSGSGHQSTMANDIGNPTGGDPLVLDRYMARASNLASKNNPYAEIHLFVNNDEALTPLSNHQSYYDNALAAAEFTGEFDNITHHIGFPGLYEDFNEDGQDTANELQYWPHQKQDEDQQAAAENWFIDRMAAKQIAPPTLNESDELQVAGYIKTKPFALFLGDGENAAATLDYEWNVDGDFSFSLEILSSDTAVPTLLQVDASAHANLMVDIFLDGELVESVAGGGVIETNALTHNTTLTVDFTSRPAPAEPILPQPEALAYWRFESSASFLEDSGPGGHTLSATGSTEPSSIALPATPLGEDFPSTIQSTDEENLGAAEMSGAGYFSAGNDVAHQPSSFTLEALVSTTGFGSSTQYIASRFTSSTQRSWSFGMTGTGAIPNTSATGELFLVVSSTGSDAHILGSGQTLTAGDDYYVSVSFVPGEPVTFRTMNLSAAEPNLTTTTVASPVNSLYNTTAPFLIGAYNGGANSWSGLIDEVRLSTGALIESHLLIASGLRQQDWRNHYFSESEQLDPAIGATDADPDEDGFDNQMEFALGTDPKQSNVSPINVTALGNNIQVTFSVMESPDITGVLWYTHNLLSPWTAVEEASFTDVETHGFLQTKAYQVALDMTKPQCFFRVEYDVSSPAVVE